MGYRVQHCHAHVTIIKFRAIANNKKQYCWIWKTNRALKVHELVEYMISLMICDKKRGQYIKYLESNRDMSNCGVFSVVASYYLRFEHQQPFSLTLGSQGA